MEKKTGFADKYFLEKVSLSGYKSIRQTEVEFKNNLSIIIGKNGSGKTNFLSFLNRVLNDNVNNLYEFTSTLNFVGEKKVSVSTKKIISDKAFKQQQFIANDDFHFSVSVNGDGFFFEGNEYPELLNLYQQEKIVFSSTLVKHGIPSNFSIVDKPFSFTITDKGIPSFMADEFSPESSFFINGLLTSFVFRRNGFEWRIEKNVEVDLAMIKTQLSESIFSWLEIIKPYLQEFSPIEDSKFSNSFNVFEGTDQERFKITNLFIEFKVNGVWYPFSSLSDGTRRMFYIIAEIASPFTYFFREGWFGFSEENYSRIILIEEPELGIHPHQLRKLMLFLKEQSRTKQIIITTHSPEVLDILEPDELNSIILSYYDKEKGTLLRHLTDKEKEKAQAYIKEDFLSDYWMHSNLEPAN